MTKAPLKSKPLKEDVGLGGVTGLGSQTTATWCFSIHVQKSLQAREDEWDQGCVEGLSSLVC